MSRQSPEIYNMVFQNHTQPLLYVFKALLLIHFHGAQPIWPIRVTPTYLNQLKPCRRSSNSVVHLSQTEAK